jgi:hypothetical protein
VVVGDSREETKVPIRLKTTIPMAFPQGTRNQCLYLCLASALDYMGLKVEALKLAARATTTDSLTGNDQIKLLTQHMMEIAPSIGVGVVFNSSQKRKKKTDDAGPAA